MPKLLRKVLWEIIRENGCCLHLMVPMVHSVLDKKCLSWKKDTFVVHNQITQGASSLVHLPLRAEFYMPSLAHILEISGLGNSSIVTNNLVFIFIAGHCAKGFRYTPLLNPSAIMSQVGTWNMGPGIPCGSACICANVCLSNRIQRNFKGKNNFVHAQLA